MVLDGRADYEFDRLAVLDIYESFIWTDRYNGYGDFEIYTAPTEEMLRVLQNGNYIWNEDSEHMMVIENVKIETDPEEGNKLYITGRSLESILDRRIVWTHTSITGNLQLGIRRLLIDAMIAPEDEDRKIPHFGFKMSEDERITSIETDIQLLGENLYDVITSLCEANGLGWKVTFQDHYISTTGQYGEGNIDLYNRPVYHYPDGSIATVESFSVYLDDVGKEVLLPTIIWDSNHQPAQIREDDAIDYYYETGEYLGMFDTPEEATDYAIMLHEDQERLYTQEPNQYWWLFELYMGTDRSYNQTENPYVVFSPKFDNIAATNYLESSKTLKNVALIGGEGEGADRITTSIQNEEEVWGLDRREIFVDASGVSTTVNEDEGEEDDEEVYDPYWGYNDDNPWRDNDDDDDDDEDPDDDDDSSNTRTLSDEEYFKLLQDKGNEELANYTYTKKFEGEVDTHRIYVYGKDFFMGDLVQMRNEYGIEAVSRITELVLSHDTSGLETYPTLTQVDESSDSYTVTSQSGSVSNLINQKESSDVAALNERIDNLNIDMEPISSSEITADFRQVFPEIFTS